MIARIFFVILGVSMYCSSLQAQHHDLRPGDILFQDLDCGDLCDAIESVTEGVDGRDFSHCGIVVNLDGNMLILEAIGDEVQLTHINDFYSRSDDLENIENIVHTRVKDEYGMIVEQALMDINSYIGLPYDDVFLMDNGSYYCSELIYDMFKDGNDGEPFFGLEPMTYKQPSSDDFFPAWIEYYKKLNADIPEGELGINPGLISRSPKLRVLE